MGNWAWVIGEELGAIGYRPWAIGYRPWAMGKWLDTWMKT